MKRSLCSLFTHPLPYERGRNGPGRDLSGTIWVTLGLEGAADHGVSEALYLRDPDGNGVELYWDRPKEQWPLTPDGSLAMFTHRLDLDDLLRQREA